MSRTLPLAPVPVGVVDGSLKSDQVDHWDTEQRQLKLPHPSDGDVSSCLSSAAAANDCKRLEELCTSGATLPKRQFIVDALCYAAGAGSQKAARYLLTRITIDEATRTGRTALHWACRNGRTDMCKMLVEEYGANVSLTTQDGISCLAWAVWGGNLDTVQWAIQAGCDPWLRNRWGCGLIHWAAAGGDVALCRYLQDDVGLDFALKNNQGHSGLSKACWNNHKALCDMLLFDNNQVTEQQYLGNKEGFPRVSRMLQEQDRAGLRAFEIARTNGHLELSKWLFTLTEGTPFDKAYGCATSEDTLDNPEAAFPAAFIVYYRTQQLVPQDQWPMFLRRLQADLPIFLQPHGRITAAWIASQFELSCKKGQVARIAKSRWLQNKALRNKCLRLEGAGLLTIEQRGTAQARLIVELLQLKDCKWTKLLYIKCNETSIKPVEHIFQEETGGAVLLNDYNAKLLISNTAQFRTSLSSSSLLLTVSNPTKFPCLFDSDAQTVFERIVVQPECSRDGEFRSNPHMIQQWTMNAAIKHHSHCKKLLFRGLHNLFKGGRLVYVTSSLNPLENEAVVLAALKRFKGSVALVPVKTEHTNAGFQKWLVPDKTMLDGQSLFRFLDSFEAVGEHDFGTMKDTLFCDGADEYNLERCVRVDPRVDEDSDACFLAVFTKTHHEPAVLQDWVIPNALQKPTVKHMRKYVPITESAWASISQFYGMSSGNKLYFEYLAGRTEPSSICLLDDKVASLEKGVEMSAKIYTVFAGLRLFEPLGMFLSGCSCRWRPAQSGLKYLVEMCSQRTLSLNWINQDEWTFEPVLEVLLRDKKVDFSEHKGFERVVQNRMCPGGMVLTVETNHGETAFHLSCVLTATQVLLHADRKFVDGIRVYNKNMLCTDSST